MSARNDWKEYAVGEPSKRANWTNPDCCPLDKVHHTCHVGDAFRMLEDGKIRSSLIWDESRLNNTRTCVSWLSPNHWSDGSLYGNIEFHFDWRELVEGKNFFWVEVIKKYRPHAFRILITDKEKLGDLEPYPVESGGGPLFFDRPSNEWYANGRFTGEFMLDEDLPLRRCTGIGFCNHHGKICRKEKSACKDLDLPSNRAGALFLSKAISQALLDKSPRRRKLFMAGDDLNRSTSQCVYDILGKLLKSPTSGNVKSGNRTALAIASAILDRFARGRKLDPLTKLFVDSKQLELAVRERMAVAFDMDVGDFPSTSDSEF
jgi:hypothetical protein